MNCLDLTNSGRPPEHLMRPPQKCITEAGAREPSKALSARISWAHSPGGYLGTFHAFRGNPPARRARAPTVAQPARIPAGTPSCHLKPAVGVSRRSPAVVTHDSGWDARYRSALHRIRGFSEPVGSGSLGAGDPPRHIRIVQSRPDGRGLRASRLHRFGVWSRCVRPIRRKDTADNQAAFTAGTPARRGIRRCTT